MKLFDALEIRRTEEAIIDGGVSVDTLIERAGAGLAHAIKKARRVAVIIGGGNNGADGVSATLNLLDRGVEVDLFTVGEIKSEYSKKNIVKLSTMGVQAVDIRECSDLSSYDTVVDCIFGIGLNRTVEGVYREAIERIDLEANYVVSADIPSGISSDTGDVLGVAVVADVTVSFSGGKIGYFLSDAIDHVGDIVYVDVGINCTREVANLVEDVTFDRRLKNTHKGSYGKVTLISGCPKYVGAGLLAERSTRASLRSGAGLIKLCVPYSMREVYAKRVVEQTLDFLPDEDGWVFFDKGKLDELISWSDVIVIGMGLGNTEEVGKIVKYLVENAPCVVLDADALNAISNCVGVLKKGRRVVITPHLGEFARLLGKGVKEVNLITDAKAFAKEYGVTVHLKGATSITVDETGETYITASGTPALAKGGSGDVLSGVVASMIAQGVQNAVATASFIHGEAGRLASVKFGEYGTLASDVADKIAEVIVKHTQK